MKTTHLNSETIQRKWFIVDAAGKSVGRLATRVAAILRGKHKPAFSPHYDCGDNVIITNAAHITFTGKKMQDKMYFTHSGHPGGGKTINAETLLAKKPTMIIQHAIRGMIPHNRLGRQIMKKLKVYSGTEHPHTSQKPEVLEV